MKNKRNVLQNKIFAQISSLNICLWYKHTGAIFALDWKKRRLHEEEKDMECYMVLYSIE